jgi:hypothetical protein
VETGFPKRSCSTKEPGANQSNLKTIVLQSMIPKSGNRFSDKIMLKTKNLDRDPIN